eukprot:1401053-Prorocentrum_lima.AAC.1
MGRSEPLSVGNSTAYGQCFRKRKVCSLGRGCFFGCRDMRCLMEVGRHPGQTGSGSTMFGIAKYPIDTWIEVGWPLQWGVPGGWSLQWGAP